MYDENKGQKFWTNRSWERVVELFKRSSMRYQKLSRSSKDSFETTLDAVSTLLKPESIEDFTSMTILEFGCQLRTVSYRKTKRGPQYRSEATIARHFRTLRVLLRWCEKHGLLQKMPSFEMPNPGDSKGRPLSEDELKKLLNATTSVYGHGKVGNSWQYLIRGLWLSGLRIAEAEQLSWDNINQLHVDLRNPRSPLFVFPPHSQKNRKRQVVPMAPDFAEFLKETPQHLRCMSVFNPLNTYGYRVAATKLKRGWCSDGIVALSRIADIRVSEMPDDYGETIIQYATAHDLRRSFGFRWASLVPVPVLKSMMRHSSVSTTLKYYATADAMAFGEQLHAIWTRNHEA